MTDNEIIKALHVCTGDIGEGCPLCPYNNTIDCSARLIMNTLDLINRQRAEIERHKGVIKILEKDVATAKSEVIKEFVERLLDECLEYPLRDGDLTILINRRDFDNLVKEMTEGVKDDD